MMGEEQKYAFGYVRVSTDAQAQSGLGVAAQKESIEKYYRYKLAGHGVEWGGFYTDEAVSGRIDFIERERGGELNARMRVGDHIIFSRMDRAFRSCHNAVWTLQLWQERGIVVHILNMNVDTSTSWGKFMIQVAAAMAELERNLISERTREGLRHSKNRIRRRAGIGYKKVRRNGRLIAVPDEKEIALMDRIVGWRESGFSYHEIASHLIQLGVLTKEGKNWGIEAIRRAYLKRIKMLRQEAEKNQEESQQSPGESPS